MQYVGQPPDGGSASSAQRNGRRHARRAPCNHAQPGDAIGANALVRLPSSQEATMKAKTTAAMQSRVLVARRYVERGFLDTAMRLFAQNSEVVEREDWTGLADKMIERDRIAD